MPSISCWPYWIASRNPSTALRLAGGGPAGIIRAFWRIILASALNCGSCAGVIPSSLSAALAGAAPFASKTAAIPAPTAIPAARTIDSPRPCSARSNDRDDAPRPCMQERVKPQSSGRRALGLGLEDIERLAGGHEQAVALRPAKGEIGAYFGQTNTADQLAGRVEHQNPGIAQRRIGTAPKVAGDIGAHAVGPAFDPVDHHISKQAPVDRPRPLHIKGKDYAIAAGSAVARAFAGADHVKRTMIGGEADAVGIGELFFADRHFEPAARVPAVDIGRQFALAAADRPGIFGADAGVEKALRVGRTAGLVGMALGDRVAVRRVGKPDAAVRMGHQIIGRIERLALVIVGD